MYFKIQTKAILPAISDIVDAQHTLGEVKCIYRIPLIPLHHDEHDNVFLKLENLQAVGSFKLRAAANVLLSNINESNTDKRKRIVTPSAGNMGQGVAWMAKYLNKQKEHTIEEVVVIAPDHLPQAKQQAMERLGAIVIPVPFNTWWTVVDQESKEDSNLPSHHYLNHPKIIEHFGEHADEWENIFVHPVFDTKVMAGNGTIGLEIVEDLPSVDTVLIPYGGGALACGIAQTIKLKLPNVKV